MPTTHLYDYDLPEHTIVVQDWIHEHTSSLFSLHHHGTASNLPPSILINGKLPKKALFLDLNSLH